MKRTYLLLLFLLSLVFSILVNELNLSYIKAHNPENRQLTSASIVGDATVYNIDNVWYLPQFHNFLDGKGFTLDPDDPYMYVRRTPGYPLFYGAHLLAAGEKDVFFFIRYTQCLLFAISTVLLSLLCWCLFNNKIISYLTGLLYALSPFVAGYLYYTITEALFPSFVIFTLYFVVRAYKNKTYTSWFFAGLFAAAMILIRPLTAIMLVSLAIALLSLIIRYKSKFYFKAGIVFTLGLSLLVLPWTIRNYKIVGDFVPLEKFYNEDPMFYGKSQTYFRKWWSSWENPSAEIASSRLVHEAQNNSTDYAEEFVSTLPERAIQGYSREELKHAVLALQDCYKYKIDSGIGIRSYKPGEDIPTCEETVKEEFIVLTEKYKAAAPLQYYVVTPLRLMKEFVFHSFSSMYISLNPSGRDFNLLQIIIKSGMLGLNLLLHLSLVFFLFFSRDKFIKLFFGGSYILTMLLLCSGIWGIRYVESRYMLQLYPVLYINLGWSIWWICNRLKKKAVRMYESRRRRAYA